MNTLMTQEISSQLLDDPNIIREKHLINNDNWNFKSDVQAEFNIGHNKDNIFLCFTVQELYVKAIHTEINQAVYEDSCVEFFVSFDKKKYYNFEFNCIGNFLCGYGTKDQRERLNVDVLKQITTSPSLGKNKIDIFDRKTKWVLDVTIPKEVFVHSQIDSFINKKVSCNFMKCGDKLKAPHYLSWIPIDTKTPDFHRPEFFGNLYFE